MEKTAEGKNSWSKKSLKETIPKLFYNLHVILWYAEKWTPEKWSPKNGPREKYLVTGYHLFSQGQFSRAYSAIPFERIFYFYRLIPLYTPRCLTLTPRFFFFVIWVCLRVLRLFRTFHAHTTMLNARPTIFCFRALVLFRTFHAHTTMLSAHPTIFVSEFWVCFEHSTHTPRCSTPAPRFFVSEFWVSFDVIKISISNTIKRIFHIFTLFSFSLHFHRPFFSSTFLSIGCFFRRPFFSSAVFSLGYFFLGLFFPGFFFLGYFFLDSANPCKNHVRCYVGTYVRSCTGHHVGTRMKTQAVCYIQHAGTDVKTMKDAM